MSGADRYRVEFLADAAAFLAAGEPYLSAHPVEVNVITVVAHRRVEGEVGDARDWFALVRDGAGDVVGALMRTAPFEPRPVFVSPMPAAAGLAVARALHERGEHPGGANGALPASQVIAEESARLWGGSVQVAMASRLWVLGALVEPRDVLGHSRLARESDLDICLAWFKDFHRAAREQAGNTQAAQGETDFTTEEVLQRIRGDRIVLWEDAGEVVHLTGLSHPVLGVGRIGPVYTPKEHRGHGYASAAVAEASRRILAAGGQVCLYTDLDNPVSNGVYARLGFEPVADAANHTVTIPTGATH